jgi:hypothetical protein
MRAALCLSGKTKALVWSAATPARASEAGIPNIFTVLHSS